MAANDYCEQIHMGVQNWENPLKTFILQPRTPMLKDITSDWGAKHSATLIYFAQCVLSYQLICIHVPSGISLFLTSAALKHPRLPSSIFASKHLRPCASPKIFDFAKSRNKSTSTVLLVSYGAAFKGLKLLGAPACHSVSKQGHMLPSQ